MGITARTAGAKAGGTGNSAALDIDASGFAAGDLVLAFFDLRLSGGMGVTDPGSFAQMKQVVNTTPTPDCIADIEYDIFESGDTDPTFTLQNGVNGWIGCIAGFNGVHSRIYDVDAATSIVTSTGNSASPVPTGITTVTPNACVLSFIIVNLTGGQVDITTAQGFTTWFSGASYQDTAHTLGMAATYKVVTTPGAVTCPTYHLSLGVAKDYAAITVALAPAVSSPASYPRINPALRRR